MVGIYLFYFFYTAAARYMALGMFLLSHFYLSPSSIISEASRGIFSPQNLAQIFSQTHG